MVKNLKLTTEKPWYLRAAEEFSGKYKKIYASRPVNVNHKGSAAFDSEAGMAFFEEDPYLLLHPNFETTEGPRVAHIKGNNDWYHRIDPNGRVTSFTEFSGQPSTVHVETIEQMEKRLKLIKKVHRILVKHAPK